MTPRAPGPWPSRDPAVYSRPGAASVRQAALWDAIYELAIGNVIGITPEGAQALIDQSIAEHEGAPDPHPVYVTVPEGDLRWGASSGLAPHTHEAEASGGVIDYLRTQWGTDHLNAPSPHPQYQTLPQVQTQVDAAIAALKAEPDPFPVYLTQQAAAATFLTPAAGDLRYLPITYTPPPVDLSDYWTKAEADGRFVDASGDTMSGPLAVSRVQARPGLPLVLAAASMIQIDMPTNGYLVPLSDLTESLGIPSNRWKGVYAGEVGAATVTVGDKPLALSAQANQTLQWLADGLFSDAPTKAQYDALVARVAALEAQVAALQGQMGAGANGHYHLMGTWRQTAKATLPTTVLEEVPAA